MHTIKVKGRKVLLLSDTHGRHRLLDIPKGIDMIIHCGDVCNGGDMDEVLDFFDWYAQLAIMHKVFIHGNHDLVFELAPERGRALVPKNVHWLNDSSVRINGVNIMGITAFPFFHHTEASGKVDIIASHYPPFGILDDGCGSEEISRFIHQYPPMYHVFGHNHSGYGATTEKGIHYINASIYHKLCQKEKL